MLLILFNVAGDVPQPEEPVAQPGGGSSAPSPKEWWRSPPRRARKNRRTEPPQAVDPTPAIAGTQNNIPLITETKSLQLLREAEQAVLDAMESATISLRRAEAAKANERRVAALRNARDVRARQLQEARAAMAAEIERQRVAAIIAEDDMILLLAA